MLAQQTIAAAGPKRLDGAPPDRPGAIERPPQDEPQNIDEAWEQWNQWIKPARRDLRPEQDQGQRQHHSLRDEEHVQPPKAGKGHWRLRGSIRPARP